MQRSILILFGILIPLGLRSPSPGSGIETPGVADTSFNETVFFAILEGCYQDGLSVEEAQRIVRWEEGAITAELFVTGCPLCGPAYQAFYTFAHRKRNPNLKGDDVFGRGLEPELRKKLMSEDLQARFSVVQTLTERWVKRRLDLMRLSEKERRQFSELADGMREKGTAILQTLQQTGGVGRWMEFQKCAVCDGANAGCKKE